MFDPLVTYGYLFGPIHHFFVVAAPDMPPSAWWVAAVILFVLGAGAVVDSFTATIPDPLIFLGMVALVGLQGYFVTWPFASHQLMWGMGAAALIWGVNEIWFRLFKQDALGFGDAKWSMLAVTGFGWLPVLFAWGVGAVVGSIWIGALRMMRRPTNRVHFAPFLFVGLVAGLWVVRFGGWQLNVGG